MIRVTQLIKAKRDGAVLQSADIAEIVRRYTHGDLPDYQMAAWLMAVYFNGLSPDELHALTQAMLHSGDVLNHDNVPLRKVDKHSTGGVGDKISIPLAPAVAAAGVAVPMMSGRGLGHTGGTLDKLESIPGFDVFLDARRANQLLKETGLFLIGQTDNLAPADKKLYALRDVTGTVESIPLISSSIMSKKLAEGIDGLVLDVKFGKGAFMRDYDDAKNLARTLRSIGVAAGKQVHALLTNMNAPLGYAVGNSLEMVESIAVLNGEDVPVVRELVVELGGHMLVLGDAAATVEAGKEKISAVLDNGKAMATFMEIVEKQGGDTRTIENPSLLPSAAHRETLAASQTGYVTAIDPMAVALGALEVNAGRRRKEDAVDHATGVVIMVQVGDTVKPGQPLAVLHHNNSGKNEALRYLDAAFTIEDAPPASQPLIADRLV